MDNQKPAAPTRTCRACDHGIDLGAVMYCNLFSETCLRARQFGGICGPDGKSFSHVPPMPADMAQLSDDAPETTSSGAAPIIGVDVGSYGQPDHADHDEDAPLITNRRAGKIALIIFAALMVYGAWEAVKYAVSVQ